MRAPSHHSRDGDLNGDAMTPMIDVVFLLLVFFVCASVGQAPEVLLPAELSAGTTETQVEPPDAENDEHQEVRIRLTPGDAGESVAIQLNERPVPSAAELRLRLIRLSEADPQTRIILIIDDMVTVQQGIAIMDLCDALNFEDVSLGTQKGPES